MGLDTYAARTPERELTVEDAAAFADAGVRLCECDGEPRFRGKVYAEVVEEVTGQTLYAYWIPPAVVRQMADDLDRCDPEEAVRRWVDVSPAEVPELRRFFRLCAERGLGLVSDW